MQKLVANSDMRTASSFVIIVDGRGAVLDQREKEEFRSLFTNGFEYMF